MPEIVEAPMVLDVVSKSSIRNDFGQGASYTSTTADRGLLRGSLCFDCQRDADLRAIFTLQMVSIA